MVVYIANNPVTYTPQRKHHSLTRLPTRTIHIWKHGLILWLLSSFTLITWHENITWQFPSQILLSLSFSTLIGSQANRLVRIKSIKTKRWKDRKWRTKVEGKVKKDRKGEWTQQTPQGRWWKDKTKWLNWRTGKSNKGENWWAGVPNGRAV